MISELNDQEILDFLMTSDFEGDYSPEELKYLLLKWRYFYRVLNGTIERDKTEWNFENRKLSDQNQSLQNQLNSSLTEIASKQNVINELKSRKLSWKERISGKIIHTQNEDQ